ncbi:hypothetical protein FACS189485_02310 [Spirochaetia bacterium]|nr:hypothetical protein FACS189485_02310 [Spirochaetia bacterium]
MTNDYEKEYEKALDTKRKEIFAFSQEFAKEVKPVDLDAQFKELADAAKQYQQNIKKLSENMPFCPRKKPVDILTQLAMEKG